MFFIRSGDDDRIKSLHPCGNFSAFMSAYALFSACSKYEMIFASKKLMSLGLSVSPDKPKIAIFSVTSVSLSVVR